MSATAKPIGALSCTSTRRLWHWDSARGLASVALSNVPGGIEVVPAGACF